MLTSDAIARAVLDVGFLELTFAAVSKRLGVGQTTLFRYVKDRTELTRLGLDLLIEEADWPAPVGPWREVMKAYALTAWHLWASAPGSATEAARGPMPRGTVRLMGELCGLLVGQGFTARDAVRACDLVFDLVGDSRRAIENSRPLRLPVGNAQGRDVMAHCGGTGQPGAAGETVTVLEGDIREALADALASDPLEWFASKLSVVLDGIAASLAPSS